MAYTNWGAPGGVLEGTGGVSGGRGSWGYCYLTGERRQAGGRLGGARWRQSHLEAASRTRAC